MTAVNFTKKKSEQLTLVKGYETAITTAYGNIVLAPADHSVLLGLIDEALNLNRSFYTTDSLYLVDQERGNGQTMVANGYKKPLQFRVDEKVVALENALNSLEFRRANYSEVEDVWTHRPAYTNYTDESVYDLVYFYEQEINTTLGVNDQAIVDGYADTLRDLIDALVLKNADYTTVMTALEAIPDNDGNDAYFDKEELEKTYSTSSVANLENKINAVDWGKKIDEQQTVYGYAQAIELATSQLIPKNADYSFLETALNKPLLLPVSYYTEASYQVYQNKMNVGWNLYNNQNLSILQQSIINQATQDINDAYGALTPKTVNYTVKYQTTDETPLQLAIDVVKTGPAGSQVTETALDITGYTPVAPTIQFDLTGTNSQNIIIFAYNINQYTVTFDSNGGTDVDAITQNYNTTVAQPDDPTRMGYVFAGWYLDEALTTAVT